MDRIRPILKSMYIHRFWITCGVVALASLLTWFLASSAVDAQREKSANNLKNQKNAIDRVLQTSADTGIENVFVKAHPNDGTETAMDGQIGNAAQGALEAWKVRYDQQAKILKFAPELPEHVRDALARNSPPEKLPFGEKDPIGDNLRDTYREYIVKRMPVLAEIVGSSWKYDEDKVKEAVAGTKSTRGQPSGVGRPSGGSGPGLSAEVTKVAADDVIWDETNQDLWNTKVTKFNGLDGNEDQVNRPTTHQMLALQQDLWILEAMLTIIAEVNEGIEGNDLVPVERIDHILVGKEAMVALGKLSEVTMKVTGNKKSKQANQSKGLKKKRRRAGTNTARAKASLAAKSGPEFDQEASESPFHGRYVDRNYEKLSADQVTKVLTSQELSEKSYLAVAKRVPVRVAVIMDERKIPTFLTASVNSPFNFEVRQVRLNKHFPGEMVQLATAKATGGKGAKDLSRSGGGPAGGGAYADSSDTAGAGGGGGGGGGSSDGKTIAPPERRSSFDVKVEFVGIVKMYNPVNPKLFGVQADADTATNPGLPKNTATTQPSAGQ